MDGVFLCIGGSPHTGWCSREHVLTDTARLHPHRAGPARRRAVPREVLAARPRPAPARDEPRRALRRRRRPPRLDQARRRRGRRRVDGRRARLQPPRRARCHLLSSSRARARTRADGCAAEAADGRAADARRSRRSSRRSSGISPTSATSRSCGSCARVGGRDALLDRSTTTSTTRSRTHARARASCRSCRRTRHAPMSRRSAKPCSRSSPTLSFDDGDPLLKHGFVVGMVVQHELQHGETMAQTLAAGRPGARTSCPEVEASGEVLSRPVRSRSARPIRGPTTTSGRRTRSSCRRSGSTARSSRTPSTQSLSAPSERTRQSHRTPRRAGRPRLLRRGGGVRALGRQAPADRGRVGEGREDGGGARALRAAPSGSGRRRSSTAIRAFAPFPTPSTRRCSSATSTASCAAVPGRPTRSSRGRVPQLGPPAAAADLLRPRCAAMRSAATGHPASVRGHRLHAGACSGAEGAARRLALRRARVAAVRGGHAAARVLPAAPRGGDPARALGRHRRDRRAHADRARLRQHREHAAPARRAARARSSVSSRST